MKCVEDGQIPPQHMVVIDGLQKEDNMMQGLKANRGKWAEGLTVKDLTVEKAKVAFHAGCRYCFDEELWPTVRGGLSLLVNAGVDIGILGSAEVCCGGRAYEEATISIHTSSELPKSLQRNHAYVLQRPRAISCKDSNLQCPRSEGA